MAYQKTEVSRPEVVRDAAALRKGAKAVATARSSGRRPNLEPENEHLWKMLTVQARARFLKFPSPTASAWVHRKYVQMGGKFIDPKEQHEREKRDKAVRDRVSGKDKDKDKDDKEERRHRHRKHKE